MTTLIRATGVGKRYFTGANALGTLSLRDRLTDLVRRRIGPDTREFWALREVSFELARGQVLGVIGRNGAGKSTLLKLVSEITDPTEGEIHLYGRVASLLEVGVGFHPELSGRENVFLNGAILGMSRAEIRRKFDEIVTFAEVEKFIDTPVKRYSSGMYVRLAFAVAAHLEPDILIVDEVLAVGDAAFQQKCLGKMRDVAQSDRAIIVVSHNTSIVAQLCTQAIWLDQGRLVLAGGTREVLSAYLEQPHSGTSSWCPPPRPGSAVVLHDVSVVRDDRGVECEIPGDTEFTVVFDYEVRGALAPGRFAIGVTTFAGVTVFASANTDGSATLRAPWKRGRHKLSCRIPGALLMPGRYFLTVTEPLDDGRDVVHDGVITFTISDHNNVGARDGRGGVIAPLLSWIEETIT